MVDKLRVRRLLLSVSDDLRRLEVEAGADEVRREDPMWLPGVKYTPITAIEGCVDVAQHLCASEGWGPPADNGDAVRMLARHGVLRRDSGGQHSAGRPGSAGANPWEPHSSGKSARLRRSTSRMVVEANTCSTRSVASS